MELDRYPNLEYVEDNAQQLGQVDPQATYYPHTTLSGEITYLLPMTNFFTNDQIDIYLMNLRKSLGTSVLSPRLQELYQQFQLHVALPPVPVRATIPITTPSGADPTRPSQLGLGSPMLIHYPLLTDYFYEANGDYDRVAMSIYFQFSHLPVVVRF